ncbi:MAG: hypothetical protein R3A10_19375 [Caldilineaceae bacterium]
MTATLTRRVRLYRQAWAQAGDDFEACVAAHYMARRQEDAAVTLDWNLRALAHADAAMAAGDTRPAEFYGSLYVNVGHAYELTGNLAEAQRFFALAAGTASCTGRTERGAACDEAQRKLERDEMFSLHMRSYAGDDDYWRIRAFLRDLFLLNNRREICWHVVRWDYWRWPGVESWGDGPLDEASSSGRTRTGASPPCSTRRVMGRRSFKCIRAGTRLRWPRTCLRWPRVRWPWSMGKDAGG